MFYPLNYGNNDICGFRFRIGSLLIPVFDTESFRVFATTVGVADCKQRTSVVCAEIASVSSYTGNYTAIQRLIQRQDTIY